MSLNDTIEKVVNCFGCLPTEAKAQMHEALGCHANDELIDQMLFDMGDSPDRDIFRVHARYNLYKSIYSEFLEDVFESRTDVNLRKYTRFCYHMGIGDTRRLTILYLSDDSKMFIASILGEVALC